MQLATTTHQEPEVVIVANALSLLRGAFCKTTGPEPQRGSISELRVAAPAATLDRPPPKPSNRNAVPSKNDGLRLPPRELPTCPNTYKEPCAQFKTRPLNARKDGVNP